MSQLAFHASFFLIRLVVVVDKVAVSINNKQSRKKEADQEHLCR
jgi:hypothetical protein